MSFETFLDRGRSRSQGSNEGQKWSNTCIELVRSITCTFMHGFQNNFAQLLPSRRKSAF